MEHLLHYVWKHKLFPLQILQTTEGLRVEVIDSGLQNSDAGPDFFNAKLKIDGTLWVGNIEIHTHSSDWYRHGHNNDKAYDSVILHVVEEADTEVTRSDGETIPQLRLTCPENIQTHYHELCRADQYPACYSIIGSLSKLTIHSWLTALQTERLEQKAKQITDRLERCNHHWEDAFFITLARNFGFGLNGDAFETWAGLLPFRAIDKHRNDLFQIEAFFFGQAGLLEEAFLKKEQEDEYSLRLRKEFRYLQRKFEMTQVMDAGLWRFLRLRSSYPAGSVGLSVSESRQTLFADDGGGDFAGSAPVTVHACFGLLGSSLYIRADFSAKRETDGREVAEPDCD